MPAFVKQSLGQYLKEVREARGLSVDEASRETNIAKRYIEALESDQFGFMPAEMYTTGFLSAYAEVLELDREAILAMYNRAVSKEQEVPLQELYDVSKKEGLFEIPFKKEMFYPLAGIIFGGLILFFAVIGLRRLGEFQKISAKKSADKNAVIVLDTLDPANAFTSGARDSLSLEREGNIYPLQFQGVRNKNQISFRLGKNQYTQKAGDVLIADLTQDGVNDIGMEIIEVSANSVRFGFTTQKLSADIGAPAGAVGFDLTPYARSILSEAPLAPVGGNTGFHLKVRAVTAVWLQHKADNNPSAEIQLDPGEEKNILFSDSLVLLVGNAGAADISIAEYPGLTFKGGAIGESSYSLFYKKGDPDKVQLFRAQLK